MPQRIVVLMTCHNRKVATLYCLESLHSNHMPENVTIAVILVDAGSTDGTVEAVENHYPRVQVVKADSSIYWNGGMYRAFRQAIQTGYDFYLWLNDDVVLYPQAVSHLLKTYQQVAVVYPNSVIIGATQDPVSKQVTYSGMRYRNGSKIYCVITAPDTKPLACDTMNGNCVLIPAGVVGLVGNLDPVFTHAMGDMDYGFRVKNAGGSLWIAPEYIGTCAKDSGVSLWHDTSLPLKQRWTKLLGPKGSPPKEKLLFCRRHCGWLWPLYFLSPYVTIISKHIRDKFR